MVLAQELLDELSDMPDEPPVMLVKKQVVKDIMKYMSVALVEFRPYYDKIYSFFEGSTMEEVGEQIFDFLKDQMIYEEESDEAQWLCNPRELLERGECDCKGYALFAAGVIDALNRNSDQGEIPWCFRFVPSAILGTKIGHVFVVLDPGGKEIWIDPVLSSFNQKPFYLVQEDRYVTEGRKVSGLRVTRSGTVIGSAESTLLSQINEYTLGMQDAIDVSYGNGLLNTITQAVVLSIVSVLVPGAALAFAAIKAGQVLLSDEFGPGSLSARLVGDITSNILTAPVTIVESILNGRTYNSDQYRAGWYYYYYVMGQTKYLNNPNMVSDAQVPAALKWFIDRTGVFISGGEHITALTQSEEAYMNLYGVNGDTTTDEYRVGPAVQVAQANFNFNGGPGSWANTIGVFDVQLVAIANETGQSVEQVNNEVASGQLVVPGVTAEGQPPTAIEALKARLVEIYSDPKAWLLTGVVVTGLLLLIFDDE
jgi:hypothetical protein